MVNQKTENQNENEEERKSRSSLRITKIPHTTIPRVDSPTNPPRSSTPNFSSAKKSAIKSHVEVELKQAEAEAKKAIAEAKKAEADAKKAELKAQKEKEKETKKKERDEKKKAYENNHSCITLQINGQEDNPGQEIRPFLGNFLHHPVSKISGVCLKEVNFILNFI